MLKLRHNKKRNLGLVYEFLTREIAAAAVSKDPERAAASLGIVSEHLSEGTQLFPELSLHRQVMESRGVPERLARRIVDELKAAGVRAASSRQLVEDSKSDLIHEMNRVLGRDVWDRHRVPDYTAHASINILMSRGISGRIEEGVEAARVEDHLIEFLVSAPGEAPRFDRDASLYAYKTAVGLFEQEFGKELTPGQTELLREYVRVALGGNPAPFERTFERQRNRLIERLRAHRNDPVFTEDRDMATHLTERIATLEALLPVATDEAVECLLLFHNLNTEIES